MKFVFFVEGYTELKTVPQFIKRWLDIKLVERIGIQVVRFEGWAELVKDTPQKAAMYLRDNDVLAVIALLDLYGLTIFPTNKQTAAERFTWAKNELETRVNNPSFFQFFAVHEVEAWLLSDPDIFPPEIRGSIRNKSTQPEIVNSIEPPSKLLNRVYKMKTGRDYKKVSQGQQLFKKLDPIIVYNKCPYFKQLIDKLVEISNTNGFANKT
jgi:hypothetical protein